MTENQGSDLPVKHIPSRRQLGKAVIAAGLTGIAARLLPHTQETLDSIKFMLGRRIVDQERVYNPPNPEALLSREASDQIFETLDLAERFPKTINKDAFHVIIQRPARLASLFYYPENKENQEVGFAKSCESFFQNMYLKSESMQVDFIGTLLMFQISGDNTPSARAQRQDVRDEQIRVGMSMAENLVGQTAGPVAIGALRGLDMSSYYAWARLQGPVTLGIHDIEIVMITRALKDLKVSLPEEWVKVEAYLKKRAPRFLKQQEIYTDLYEQFEVESDKIVEKIATSHDIQQYLSQFYSANVIKEFMLQGGGVDSYQFLRTTVYWATISELQQIYGMSFYAAKPEVLERQALERTVEYYLNSGSPTAFFLDQISNPKMIEKLEKDANRGDRKAEQLLEMSRNLDVLGDYVIKADRSIAAAIIDEDVEQDLEFQMTTGVAYSRWLLRDASAYTHGEASKRISFADPHELAYHAFLATSNRESAPSYQLAGTRPLHRATLPFASPRVLFETMDGFVGQVYSRFEKTKPWEDFRTFTWYFLHLFEEAYVRHMIGTYRHRLNPTDQKMAEFIQQAEAFWCLSESDYSSTLFMDALA